METINLRPDERQDPIVKEVLEQGGDPTAIKLARPFVEVSEQYLRNKVVANIRKGALLEPVVGTYFVHA